MYEDMDSATTVDLKTFLQILSKSDEDIDIGPETGGKRGSKPRSTKPGSPGTQGCSRCCKYMKISSSGVVMELYPSVLGTYENIKQENDCPVYKMSNKKRFLSRPQGITVTGTQMYTWGVNSKMGVTWGWIKGLEDQPCPHMISKWGVFKGGLKKWVLDETLEIKCSTKYGE